MNSDDGFRFWRWCVLVGVFVLTVVLVYRVSTDALQVANRAIAAYEHAHEPILQRTVTTWPTGEARQKVETERAPDQELASWTSTHSAAVLSEDHAAREREQAREQR